ncbi:helicase, partial [Kickxella alabastrina]
MAGSSSSSNNNSKQKGNNTSANGGGGKQKAAAEPIKDKKAGKGTKASKDTKTTKQSSKDTAIPTTGTALAAKPVLFNGWTGKTPATLLNEYVQKQPTWHRASYNVSGGTNTGGYTCSIHLSKIDPKNKSTPLAVHLRAPTSLTEKQPTPVEARHMAATYALYRMRSDTSMYLSLPPEHRAYWALLQERREDGRWKYAADPFLAQAEREKAQAEGDQARAKRAEKLRRAEEDGHREELLAPGLRARWEEMAEARMAEHHRLRVEAVVREWTRHWGVADQDAGTCTVEGLVRLGFRPAHAEEALLYARSKERAVDWLCVHVPEDDLPRQFISRVEAPSVVRGGRARAAAERALAQCGFATALVRDAVARAAERLGDAGEDAVEAVAAQLLVARLLGGSEARHGDPGPGSQPQPPGPELLFAEEVESLQAIFHGEGSRVVSKGAYALSVQLRPRGMDAAGDLRLEVWVPPGLDYPGAQAPFMAVSGALPAFLKLHVARKVAACVRADGLPVVFDAVCAAEDGLAQWVAAPPPLVELRSGVANAGAHEPSGGREPGALGAVAAPKPGRRTRPASNGTAQLAAQFARLQTDAAYQKMQAARRLLPAHARQAEIVAAVAQSGCTVIAGATGCGKTTQVPQFLLDDALRHGRPIRIVCTQPRRISAIGVATRVADERAETLGRGTVGYAVKGDAKQGADTRLLFCTTGVLLRMLGSDPLLEAVTHVVCDEVHERS